jgi:hypothetical protein
MFTFARILSLHYATSLSGLTIVDTNFVTLRTYDAIIFACDY